MKKRTRKVLLMLCCALATVAVSVGATIAYLTDTEEVTNTFTVGDVQIDLNETDTDNDGSRKDNDYHLVPGQTYVKDPTVTVKANSEPSYVRMLVTIEDYADLYLNTRDHESEINNPFVNIKDPAIPNAIIERVNLAAYMDISTDWELTSATAEYSPVVRCTYEYRYKNTTEKNMQDVNLPALFTQLTIPGCFTNDDLLALKEGYGWLADAAGVQSVTEIGSSYPAYAYPFKITVRAEAIQAAGFDNADAAWSAFDAQQAGN